MTKTKKAPHGPAYARGSTADVADVELARPPPIEAPPSTLADDRRALLRRRLFIVGCFALGVAMVVRDLTGGSKPTAADQPTVVASPSRGGLSEAEQRLIGPLDVHHHAGHGARHARATPPPPPPWQTFSVSLYHASPPSPPDVKTGWWHELARQKFQMAGAPRAPPAPPPPPLSSPPLPPRPPPPPDRKYLPGGALYIEVKAPLDHYADGTTAHYDCGVDCYKVQYNRG